MMWSHSSLGLVALDLGMLTAEERKLLRPVGCIGGSSGDTRDNAHTSTHRHRKWVGKKEQEPARFF